MKQLTHLNQYRENKPCILTIGTFDGVHLGHQKIINALVEEAKQKNLLANILTFFPHPRMVLQQDQSIKLIDTLEEKKEALATLGVDHLIIHPFSEAFSRLTALEFARDILVERLHVAKIIVGYDHRFGRNREATAEDLKTLGNTYSFEVTTIPPQAVSSIAVSSTKIRKALLEGNITEANRYLNRPYQIQGTVVKGDGIGRTLSFPTANIEVQVNYKLLPAKGVYLVAVPHKGKLLFGMMNYGLRPTVNGEQAVMEVHLFDFNQDIYGQKLTLQLLLKIRDEQKFESLTALKGQILKDKAFCLSHIEQNF
ncbi:MAG: bifunctional riboflavin kinase/FAD synthetase [Flavobacteriaceae bacterium]